MVPNLYPALADPSRGSESTDVVGKEPRNEGDMSATGATEAEAGAFASSGDPLLASRKAGG